MLHLIQSLSIEEMLMLQVGLLAGFWELCIVADFKERESVVAWEVGKEHRVGVLFLGRAKLSPLAVPECWCRGLCGNCAIAQS